MKVFVAGATGVVGRRAVGSLVAAGHQVTGVARAASKANLLQGLGAVPVAVDLFDADAVKEAVRGFDAVVNLATRIPPLSRAMLPGAWNENHRIRREVSRNLVDGAIAADVQVYVQESLGFMYPDRGDAWIDEEVPVEPPPHARSALDAEQQARRFGAHGGRGVVLRFGQFYAPDATHTRSMINAARRGRSPFVGPPDAFSPPIHAGDAAGGVAAALTTDSGTYNVTDDEPLTQGELATVLAAAVGVDSLRFPPAPLLRLGGAKVRMLMRSQRVSNERFRTATGWAPAFGSAREGFPAVVREMVSDAR